MKNFLVLFFCLISMAAFAQTVRRSNQGPGFFMPKGAYQNSSAQKPAANQQRRVQPQRQYNSQPPVKQNVNNQDQQPVVKNQQQVNHTDKTQTIPVATPNKLPVLVKPQKIKLPTKINIPQVAKDIAKPSVVEEKQIMETKKASLFDQIWEDYQADLKKIKLNQKINNERLEKMLSDYKDKNIEVSW